MKNAIGGVFTIEAIVVFMIIVNCFLAFSVNYTKAFRAKNEIRSIIEKHEGLTCNALGHIRTVLNKNKYQLGTNQMAWCENNGYQIATGADGSTPIFCYKVQKVGSGGSTEKTSKYAGAYYTIVTFVNIQIPLFDRVFDGFFASVFKVKGETALIHSSGIDHSGLPSEGCPGGYAGYDNEEY